MAKLRRLAMLAAVLMVTLGLPTAIGAHLSTGGEAVIGTEAQETSQDPSVPGTEPGDPDTMYGVGTIHPDECYRSEGELGPEEALEAAGSRGFCGELVYNLASAYERRAPHDQDLRDDLVGTFDVQRVYYAGTLGFGTCLPLCSVNDHWNKHNVEVHVPHPPGLLQDETDAWQGDGWAVPFPSERWVGWLLDAGGDPIGEQRLLDHLETHYDADERRFAVCGHSPSVELSPVTYRPCEVELRWQGPAEDDDARDPCASSTYVCSPTTKAYWASASVGVAAYAGDADDHTIWHWTVAPSHKACWVAEPGFDPSPQEGPPYLAHDLDVYTPPTALSDAQTPAYTNLRDHARTAVERAPGHLETPAVVDRQAGRLVEDDIPERNHVGAESYAIDDDSRQRIEADRSFEGDCHELYSSETEETLDPWVNVLDAGVTGERTVEAYSGLADLRVQSPTVGIYGEGQHDADNDPTPGTYATEGHVGVFTDKDDDGAYEDVPGDRDAVDGFGAGPFQPGSIHNRGAYPMAWDMHVEVDDGQARVDAEAGCTEPGLDHLPLAMEEAGYGPHTGLVQAIHLAEPAAFYDRQDPSAEPVVVDEADAIHVLGSQAVRELWDGRVHDGDDDHRLGEDVDVLVEGLGAYLSEEQGLDTDELAVVQPGDRLGLDSDYLGQCSEGTGGFTARVGFTHACRPSCEGATVATMYTYEVREEAATIGDYHIPPLRVDGDAYVFPTGAEETRWFDVDPFDGDPDRSAARDTPPPTGE